MIELHRKMLGDKVRNQAFADALKKVIKPGTSIVADIGSGTGFLAFLASKLGAKECALYEYGDIIEVSKEIAKKNGITNCQFIRKHSTEVKRPIQADVVVCETLGNFAYEENIIETMGDAHRFLKPGGTMIPEQIQQFVCPVIDRRLYDEIDVWPTVGFHLDFGPARDVTLNNMYVKMLKASDLLDQGKSAKQWDAVDFRGKNASKRSGNVRWNTDAKITVYGFAIWWNCTLVPGVAVSTSPLAPPTHWEQIFLPLVNPIEADAGEVIECTIASDSRYNVKINVRWEASLIGKDGKVKSRQQMDMKKGHLD